MSDDAPTEERDGTSSSSESNESNSEQEIQVESLIAGRAKRATAGNRLSALITQEEADDELTLLFEEEEDGEDDVEFEVKDGEDASDVQLDSSSDDDDQGPAAGDDLEGEKELAKQDRAEKRKKRKAQEIYKKPSSSRKKVKIDPTNTAATRSSAPTLKPKKSERVTWLPTSAAGPVRASSRKQTVQNKEVVHQRMQENEKRRRQQIEVMEKAAKRKDAAKPKVLTQADRLSEAAMVEKTNAKSLNKWEETEKKRAEDQKARLAALHNRQIKGPYIRWWSGPSKWVNGVLVKVGAEGKAIEDISKIVNKVKISPGKSTLGKSTSPGTHRNAPIHDTTMRDAPPFQASMPPSTTTATASNLPSQIYSAPPQPGPAFLDGIQFYAPMPDHLQYSPMQQYRPLPPPAPVTEYMTRNLVILMNVDADSQKMSELQDHVLLNSKKAPKATAKALKSQIEHCSILDPQYPTRYRDPKTGLPYSNVYAYKEVQKLASQNPPRWNAEQEFYAGPANIAASGVPEGFTRKQRM